MAALHPIIDALPTTAHNDVALSQEQRIRNWQLTTWWLAALATVLVVTNCTQWLTRKEHYIPVILGQVEAPRFLAEMSPANAQSLPIKLLLVEHFIRGIRTVSLDQKFQEDRMNAAFFMCREKAQSFLRTFYAKPENDPKELQKKGISKVPVNIQVSPQTADTFTVLWVEDVQEVTGTVRTQWRADLTLETKDPAHLTSAEQTQSPFGVFVSYVNFSPLGKI
jgi:type IV secretory pathway TrbF-like protein